MWNTRIGELSQAGINHLLGDKLKEADKKRQEADAIEKENPTKATALRAQAQAIEAEYGLGSNLQMGIRAATAALQGLATGSVNQAAVGAVSPYLNKLIKEQTGDNKEANLIAHAVLGAVEAHITGNNAAAGAVGALTAEAAAPLIMQTLYGTEKPENLTDSQKQNVANLSQIAAGLSGGLVGDSTGSFVAGAEIGKRAVENNFLDQIMENPQADWQSVAQGQQAKLETEQQIREYLKQEHPVIYQTAEGTYYFLSKTGKAIYITREIVIDVAPFIVAPEMAAGTGFYSLISRAALSGGANVVAQGISGQQFNSVELTGAIVSGTVSPVFKRTIDVIRFNAGVGMATGLANGGDGLSDAALSGIATYGSMKISNPILATGVGEVIQKAPVIIQSTAEKHDKDK